MLRTPDAALVSTEPSRNSAGRSGDADDDTMVAVEALLGEQRAWVWRHNNNLCHACPPSCMDA